MHAGMSWVWGFLIAALVGAPFFLLLFGLRHRLRVRPPDDGLALRLAAAFGAPRVTYDGVRYRLAFSRRGARYELRVDDRHGSLNCLSVGRAHSARLFPVALMGRSQEDYLGGRALVATEGGWVVVQGEPALRGWETRLPPGLAEELQEHRVCLLTVDAGRIDVHGHHIDEPWVEAMMAMLTRLRTAVGHG